MSVFVRKGEQGYFIGNIEGVKMSKGEAKAGKGEQ
jgi:hypothetical protein